MPRRGSLIKEFLMDALINSKYPNLYWIDENQGIFVLSCMHKSNKDWKIELGCLYKDWHNIKNRRCKNDYLPGMRQRVLQAIKKCKFIKKLKKVSTSTDFIYQLIDESSASEPGSPSLSEESFSISPGPSPLSDKSFSSVNAIDLGQIVSYGSVTFDPGPLVPVVSSEGENEMNSHDLTNLLQYEIIPSTGSNVESTYGNDVENDIYATDSQFSSLFDLDSISNVPINGPLAAANEEIPAADTKEMANEQSLNGREVLNNMGKDELITVPIAPFLAFLGGLNFSSLSDECITLKVPSEVLDLFRKLQASFIDNPDN